MPKRRRTTVRAKNQPMSKSSGPTDQEVDVRTAAADHGDHLGLQQESEEDTLRARVQTYQDLLDAGAPSAALRAAAASALAPLHENIRKFAFAYARRRHGALARDHIDDVLSEAYALTLEELSRLDLEKVSSVRNAVLQGLNRTLPDARARTNQSVVVPRSWERVARVAATAGAELAQKLRREPTRAEIQEETVSRCRRWAKEHGHRDVTGQLRKQGTLGALEHFDALVAADRHPLSFDTPVGEADGESLYGVVADSNADPAEIATHGCLANPRLLALATGDLPHSEREAISHFLAGQTDELPDLRRHARAMASRLCAPHAQYAYLAPSIAQAFDPAPEPVTRRRRQLAPLAAGTCRDQGSRVHNSSRV